ncbi:hypothetical protein C1645_842140 [Glomus cerebriforme]|uniref:Uncharacterized protein n=1 Tax=Glomus cerebriforme TaxID=658196 RepID=A0A397S823_9GLOM|nr:hypothetical protein C1645_842140 [Glomus cerebriforme]
MKKGSLYTFFVSCLSVFSPILESGSQFFVHSVQYWNQKCSLSSSVWNRRENGSLCIQFNTGIRNGSLSSSVQTGKGNASLYFRFDTGIRNGSFGFQIKMLSNSSFSFLVDSSSVWALGIRK